MFEKTTVHTLVLRRALILIVLTPGQRLESDFHTEPITTTFSPRERSPVAESYFASEVSSNSSILFASSRLYTSSHLIKY